MRRTKASSDVSSDTVTGSHEGSFSVSTLNSEPVLKIEREEGAFRLRPAGSWTADYATVLEEIYDRFKPSLAEAGAIHIDIVGITSLDTLGAWILEKIQRRSLQLGRSADIKGISKRYAELIAEVKQLNRRKPVPVAPVNPLLLRLEGIGRSSLGALEDVFVFFQMLGASRVLRLSTRSALRNSTPRSRM